MSPTRELWKVIRSVLLADTAVMGLANAVYDKVPKGPWGAKNAYISRGPAFSNDDGADCIDGVEINLQIDVWSKANDSWNTDDIVEAVRLAVHEKELDFVDNALAFVRVELTRIMDDPDPLVTHGIVNVVAAVEVPEVS